MDITLGQSHMHHKIDRLLLHLDARVEAFAMCEVAEGWRLDLGPMPTTLLHYVIGGTGRLAGRSEPLGPGSLIVVPAGVGHQLQAPGRSIKVHDGMSDFRALTEGLLRISAGDNADLRTACATVTTRYLHHLDLFSDIDKPLVFDLNAAGRSPAIFDNLVAELREPRFGSRAIASALLKQMLVLLLRVQLDGDGAHPGWVISLRDPRIARAIGALLDAGETRPSAEDLAFVAGMSRAAFQRQFLDIVGMTVAEFNVSLRIHRAALLLAETDLPVNNIAAAIGYSSRSHFSRTFRKVMGADPTEFRQGHAPGRSTNYLRDFFRGLFGTEAGESAPD
tara:strand:- start:22182 stop:23186 length:1005 start_codon:yes stop_codon:yes gene_type:complete